MFLILFIVLFVVYHSFISNSSDHSHNIVSIKEKSSNVPYSIYYINLTKSVKRKEQIERQFSSFPYYLNRIEAITPKDISHKDIAMYKKICSKNQIVEFACLLSHLKAIHTAYHNNDSYALILEDDAIVIRMIDFSNLLTTLPSTLDWDILQMYTLDYKVYLNMDKTNQLWEKYKRSYASTLAYIINRQGMLKLLKLFFPTTFKNKHFNQLKLDFSPFMYYYNKLDYACVADICLYDLTNTYTCLDLFFINDHIPSTIHNDHLDSQYDSKRRTFKYFYIYGFKNKDIGIPIKHIHHFNNILLR